MVWSYKHQAVPVPEGASPAVGDLASQNQATAGPTLQSNAGQPGDQAGDQAGGPIGDQSRLGQAAAKAAIEADGYKGVHDLSQGPDGKWSARALRGATEISVSVAADGSVSAN